MPWCVKPYMLQRGCLFHLPSEYIMPAWLSSNTAVKIRYSDFYLRKGTPSNTGFFSLTNSQMTVEVVKTVHHSWQDFVTLAQLKAHESFFMAHVSTIWFCL